MRGRATPHPLPAPASELDRQARGGLELVEERARIAAVAEVRIANVTVTFLDVRREKPSLQSQRHVLADGRLYAASKHPGEARRVAVIAFGRELRGAEAGTEERHEAFLRGLPCADEVKVIDIHWRTGW